MDMMAFDYAKKSRIAVGDRYWMVDTDSGTATMVTVLNLGKVDDSWDIPEEVPDGTLMAVLESEDDVFSLPLFDFLDKSIIIERGWA